MLLKYIKMKRPAPKKKWGYLRIEPRATYTLSRYYITKLITLIICCDIAF